MSIHSIPKDLENVNIEIEEGTGEILQEPQFALKKNANEKLAPIIKKSINTEKPIMTERGFLSFMECGDFLLFARKHDNKLKLARANFCKSRICNMCNWRRSLKLFGQVSQVIEAIRQKDIKVRYLFLTLTVKNCKSDKLTETINQLNAGFSRLVNKNNNKTKPTKIACNLLGYMKAMEITYNVKDDTYHPHIHCILAVRPTYFNTGNYMKHEDIQALWQKCMNIDYAPQVNVRAIKAGNSTPKAIAELAKYPTKIATVLSVPADKQEEVLYTLATAIKGRRLITFGGLFKDIKAELGLTDVEKDNNLVNVGDSDEEGQVIEYVRFTWRAGVYVC